MEYNLEECFKFKINDEDDVKFINDRVEECSRQSLYREKFEKLEDIYFKNIIINLAVSQEMKIV